MNVLLKKLVAYIPKNIGAIIGIGQAFVKLGKEVCTLALDMVAPLIPGDNDTKIITKIRDIFNTVDGWLEQVKAFLLKMGI